MSGPHVRYRAVLAIACVLLAAPTLARAQKPGATLSATERTLVKSVDAHNADALALLIRIVNINSGTMNFAGVKQVAIDLAAFGTTAARRRWGSAWSCGWRRS